MTNSANSELAQANQLRVNCRGSSAYTLSCTKYVSLSVAITVSIASHRSSSRSEVNP